MRNVLIIILTVVSAQTMAAPFYQINGKQVDKIEAVKTLINNPKAEVQKCNPVQLNEKLSLVNKK